MRKSAHVVIVGAFLAMLVICAGGNALSREAEPVYYAGTGHWYEVVILSPESITWDAARQAAEDAGGYLATATCAGEEKFLKQL